MKAAFKKKFGPGRLPSPRSRFFNGANAFSLALFLVVCGCRTVPSLPPVNLSAPGWIVRQGQAIWRAKSGAPEIAGDLLFARRDSGRAFLQFTKTPFPFVTAQITTNTWTIEFALQKRRYGGHGQPPERLGWFQLVRCLEGATPPKKWLWTKFQEEHWRLEKKSTGELFEGFLNP